MPAVHGGVRPSHLPWIDTHRHWQETCAAPGFAPLASSTKSASTATRFAIIAVGVGVLKVEDARSVQRGSNGRNEGSGGACRFPDPGLQFVARRRFKRESTRR